MDRETRILEGLKNEARKHPFADMQSVIVTHNGRIAKIIIKEIVTKITGEDISNKVEDAA